MNISDDERGCAGIHCLWPITDNDDFKAELKLAKEETAFNNISPIITYSVNNGVKAIWLGDMENVFLEKIKGKVDWPEVDILFAPHHGRSSGKISSDVLVKMKPQIVVIGKAPSKNLDYYSGYNTITQNSAGSIVFDCDDSRVHIYVSNERYSVAFLDNDKKITLMDTILGHSHQKERSNGCKNSTIQYFEYVFNGIRLFSGYNYSLPSYAYRSSHRGGFYQTKHRS